MYIIYFIYGIIEIIIKIIIPPLSLSNFREDRDFILVLSKNKPYYEEVSMPPH